MARTAENDLEIRANVEPVDELLAERYEIVEKLAPLFALYGPGGLGEHIRSAELARLDGLIRAMAAGKGERITEDAIKAGTRNHPDYLETMARMTLERVEFFKLQERMNEIDFRINRGQSILRCYASEART